MRQENDEALAKAIELSNQPGTLAEIEAMVPLDWRIGDIVESYIAGRFG